MKNRTVTRMFALAAILVLALYGSTYAQGFDYGEISIDIKPMDPQTPVGGEGALLIKIIAPPGYSITDIEGVFEILPMGESEGFTFGDLQKPLPDKVDEIGGHFEGTTEFTLPFSIADDAKPGEVTITLGFRLQVCDEASGQCFLPTRPEDMQQSTIFVIGEADAEVAAGEQSLEDQFSGALAGGNLWFTFILAFLAGILSSLTPCVYPMIPITISYVSGVSEGRKRNGFFISLILVLGIAITYSILGVIAGATGGTFGAYLNHPLVQGFLFIVLVAMGLSMLGVWEIRLPAGLQNKASVQMTGYIGALFVGMTLGIVAAPCVGPILVAMLVFIAQSQNILIGLLLMFVYAIGMGLLFIVVGTFSNAILPKSGNWMVWLKKIFAFVFFIMAVYYAYGLFDSIYPGLADFVYGALFVLWGTVIGAFFRIDKESSAWEIVGKGVGILLVTTGIILFAAGLVKPMIPQQLAGPAAEGSPGTVRAEPAWITDLDEGLRLAEEEGKPLFVDIWAEWCIACHELDEFTFSDRRIIEELDRFVAVKIDGTDENDQSYKKVREHFGGKGYPVVGLPAVFIHDSSGEIVTVINRFEDADTVLPKLQAVK